MDFTPAINALMTGGLQGWKLAEEKKKNDALLAKEKAALGDSGFDAEGNPDPGYLDENNPSYKRAKQAAIFKAMASPKNAAATQPMLTVRQAHAIRGVPMPAELEGIGDQPFSSSYANLFPAMEKKGPTMAASALADPQGFAKNNPEFQVPSQFAGNFRQPPARLGRSPMTPAQRLAYSKMMKVPYEATEGMTVDQFGGGVSNMRGHEAASGRQANALLAAEERQLRDQEARDERLAKTMGQARDQFGQQMNFNKSKEVEAQIQKFRDDYAKTGIPKTLPVFERLDKLTGVISGAKPNLKKMPGQGTNALRAIPLVGQGLATMAAKTYGGEEEAQLLQSLINADIHALSGAAVTRYEEGRNLAKAGMGPGGNEQDVARGVRMMYEAFQSADRDVRAAYPPEAIAIYESRHGLGAMRPTANPSDERAKGARGSKNSPLGAYMDPSIQAVIQNPAGVDPATKAQADAKLKDIKSGKAGKAPGKFSGAPAGMSLEQFKEWKRKQGGR